MKLSTDSAENKHKNDLPPPGFGEDGYDVVPDGREHGATPASPDRLAAAVAAGHWRANGSAPITSEASNGNAEPRKHKPSILDNLRYGPAIAKQLPPVEYLVQKIGMVSGGGAPHLVAGYGFTGKTMAMQSLALSLVAGSTVWTQLVGRACRVVHVDFEQGERLTFRRYQRLAYSQHVDLSGQNDQLAVAVMPRICLTERHKHDWRLLMTGRDVILIDSLRAATGGQEENSSEIRAGLDMLTTISEETGCRAIVIHHARKPQKDEPAGQYSIRGSSAIFDACDSVYVFSSEKGEPVKIEHVKARSHGELCADFALTISDTHDKDGLAVVVHGGELLAERRAVRERDAKAMASQRDTEAVRNALTTRPGLALGELRMAAGLGNGPRLATALAVLGKTVEVRPERRGKTTASCHYLVKSPPETTP